MRRTCINTVDLFCGAGGASTGMELALERLGLVHKGLAINHWQVAVDTMKANHPAIDTKQMSVEEAVPADLVPGGVVDLLWASPSCTHHSRAKGGKPRSNQLRAQPELILTWLDQLFVRRIIIENVPEFVQWGPLGRDGRPLKRKEGACFAAWVEGIRARNYEVEWRIVNCADYGDATSRKRFFLKAVRKGCGRIRWPEPTHAENPETDLWGKKLKRWRGVRECLDLEDLGRSIYGRKTPLSENTLRKIAVGMAQYNGIFLMDMLGTDGSEADYARRCHGLEEPLPTQHAGGNRCAVVRPFIVRLNRNCFAESVDEPLFAVTAGGQHHVLCSPMVLDHFRNGEVTDGREPLGAQTTHDRFSVVTPVVVKDGDGLPRLPDGRYLDILIRMLKPSELAAAHSFPEDYKLTGNRTEQVKQIGNSVPVRTAAAMCEADLKCA
ncbi:MAG: DNA cytosine methyltransferase [Kiritimatiellae bacterium]|nr:DNA cytosine methyltransferase [Kiritimatiellia bacterium]